MCPEPPLQRQTGTPPRSSRIRHIMRALCHGPALSLILADAQPGSWTGAVKLPTAYPLSGCVIAIAKGRGVASRHNRQGDRWQPRSMLA